MGHAVTLPLDGTLSEGDYYLIVSTDAEDVQAESNESDNAAVSSAITLAFPDLPDLQVADVGVTEVNPISGQPMTITWRAVNQGLQTATGLFHDRIVVVNDTTGATILDTVLPYSPAVEGFVPANGSVDRDYVFVLPDGPAGTGNLVITITTDVDNEVLEGFVGDLHENNNTSSGSASSSLNAYPDLIVRQHQPGSCQCRTGRRVYGQLADQERRAGHDAGFVQGIGPDRQYDKRPDDL